MQRQGGRRQIYYAPTKQLAVKWVDESVREVVDSDEILENLAGRQRMKDSRTPAVRIGTPVSPWPRRH